MKLYYSPGACSFADHVALLEANLPHTLAKVDLRAKQIDGGGDYLAVNPKGYVPALELDEGGVLTENLAILAYIAERAPFLAPADELGRIRALEAAAYVSTELHKGFKPFFNPAASEAERDEARKTLAKRFGYVEGQLDGRDFLLGDHLSVADCYLLVVLLWGEKFGLEIGPRLTAFRERMKARPAVRQAMEEEGIA